MASILDIYTDELSNSDTRYFVFDTKGKHEDYPDVDFISYDWLARRFNRVRPGDLFLYRRPQKTSEIPGKFYFFGAGKISRIDDNNGHLRGHISKALPFAQKLVQGDKELEDFQWSHKQRGHTWERFFNQYGMNEIQKEDFVGIITIAFPGSASEVEVEDIEYEIELIQRQQQGNYSVEDTVGLQKRRIGQKVFSDQVKLNYGYKCALTGIRTKEFLVGSHIIPWSRNKETRLDPRNGICLSVLVDKAFDKGFITITPEHRVLLSPAIKDDIQLYNTLKTLDGMKANFPKDFGPRKEYLEWHNMNVFKK